MPMAKSFAWRNPFIGGRDDSADQSYKLRLLYTSISRDCQNKHHLQSCLMSI